MSNPATGRPATRCVGESERDELRMLLLERLQFLQQRVEGIVGDLWIVEDVVAILVVPNLVAQRGDAIGWRHG